MVNIDRYLAGQALYGDDFSPSQIAQWYADEKEGYADLGSKDAASYSYGYHAWNNFHAYRHLPDVTFQHVLGFGSAYGDEFLPIISNVKDVTIIDPSDAFVRESVHGVPAYYIKPNSDGRFPLRDNSFDLVTCFGVLHHIPNVSFVVAEIIRTMRPGGYFVLREPIVSMGDWRKPRRGLTKRERGIPLPILRKILATSGFELVNSSLCAFPLTPRVFRVFRPDVYNSAAIVRIDSILSAAFSWNVCYHHRNILERLRPSSAFFVLRKPFAQPGSSSSALQPAHW